MAEQSARTMGQFIRMAVIEGGRAYVPPSLFAKMQEAAVSARTEMEKAEELRRFLMLTDDEYRIAKVRGLEVVVDYDLRGFK